MSGNAIYLINVYFQHMFKNRQSVERFTRAILIHMNIIGQRYSTDSKLAWSMAWIIIQDTWETIGYRGSMSIKVIRRDLNLNHLKSFNQLLK